MRKTFLLPVLSLVLFGCAGAGAAEEEPGESGGFDAADMARMMELAQPGPEHEELARGAGEWDQKIIMWLPAMEGMPEMPPMESNAIAKHTMVLGGRFLMTEGSGSFMGMDVATINFVGYDRRNEEYVTVGLDTMGTYFITARGKRGEDGVLRLHGVDDDPMGRQVYTFEIEDESEDVTITRLFFSELGGMVMDPPHKMMEIRATRKAGD